ncbi:hypothetical protein TrRE_jg8936 [Triparma retinervis]|uniref:Uncharacterized protein n=1 Tax=Triparma retinervis TaxID=2557542 RepID=A0A9W6ZDP6_9STRA|nr:hypothetical protein TrRE_jg8936 [Triparma retinervis]
MKNKETTLIPNLLSPEEAKALNGLMKEFKVLNSNLADSKVTRPLHEHIGEAVPIQEPPLSICPHPYMVPDLNRTSCILANRIDIGRHYMTTGGFMGLKEPYEVAVGRLQSFGMYIFDPSSYPVVQKLFSSSTFQSTAKKTCPADKQVLDPFQFNLIVQVPGQTVATHIDGVYFWGATRFEIPQWLLAAMKFSGLFEAEFIDQIQIVGYFHDWDDDERKGDFVYWNDDKGDPASVPPKPRSGSGIDGSKVIHAANVYHPDRKPPMTDKNKQVELRYNGPISDSWTVYEDGAPMPYTYPSGELRSTIVFRARCFESEEAKERFNRPESVEKIPLPTILSTLQRDIEAKTNKDLSQLSRLELGIKIMDHYINYPFPRDVIIPINYCVLEKLLGGGAFLRFIFRAVLQC